MKALDQTTVLNPTADREIVGLLTAFRETMRKKLVPALHAKGHWRKATVEGIVRQLGEEVAELINAVHMSKYDSDDVLDEAADVAICAMFLADMVGNLPERIESPSEIGERTAVFTAREKTNYLLHMLAASKELDRRKVYSEVMEIDEELKKALPKLLVDGNVAEFIED